MAPSTHIGAWLDAPRHGAVLSIRKDLPTPQPASHEVLVKFTCSGFCHSDVHSIYGETPMTTNIAGHEGVGIIVAAGSDVDQSIIGSRVGVQWLYSTCGQCEICKVKYSYCPEQHNSGRDVPGTFQQYAVAPARYVTPIPEELESETAAPLLCAGVTMFTAIGKLSPFCKAGDWVVILGAGGGLGHLGVQIARARGYKVIAVDSSTKREMCLQLGATVFVDFLREDVEKSVRSHTDGIGAHGIIVTVGSTKAYEQAPKLLRQMGTLVCVGIPNLDFQLPISPFQVICTGINVVGTTVGTREDIMEVLEMAKAKQVVPVIKVFEFEEINEVMEKLARFEIDGRAVLKIPQ